MAKMKHCVRWIALVLLGLGAPVPCAAGDPLLAQAKPAAMDFEVTIADGAVAEKTLRVTRGDTVRILVQSDAATTLHLHGYDIEVQVTPDKPTTLQFDAYIAGRFPIASHGDGSSGGHGHRALMYLEVHPE